MVAIAIILMCYHTKMIATAIILMLYHTLSQEDTNPQATASIEAAPKQKPLKSQEIVNF
jgi:hypothetical protein